MPIQELLRQGLLAAAGTLAFAVLFHVAPRHYAGCALVGCVGWVVYALSLAATGSTPLSTLIATVPLTLLVRLLAVRFKTPGTVFLLCGIFPLVPGAGIYYTAYGFFMGDSAQFVQKGTETLKIALALAVGIAVVLSMPLPGAKKMRRG